MTGRYKLGNPRRIFGHGVWVQAINDSYQTELDGRDVILDGEPVIIWGRIVHQTRT